MLLWWESGLTEISSIKYLFFLFYAFPLATTGQVFSNAQFGYSIELDDRYQLTTNNDITFFRSDNSGVVIIKNWPGLSEETARDYMQQGYQDERLAIVAEGEPEVVALDNGKSLLVDIEGIHERKRIKGIAGSFIGNAGQGMVVLVSAEKADWNQVKQEAERVLASVSFSKAASHHSARDWWYMLAGNRLVRRDISGGKQLKEDIEFCGNGIFYHRIAYSDVKHGDQGSFMGFSRKQKSGRWRVIDHEDSATLLLRYVDGREERTNIEDRMGQTFIDGQRYYMLRSNRCW